MKAAIRLQPLARSRVATLGEAGTQWLAALPRVLGELEERWHVRLDRPLPGGSTAYVVSARRAGGARVVIKVVLEDPGLAQQAATLRAADGCGYVRLLDHDVDRGALLMEGLGESLEHSRHEPPARLAILAETLRLAWQVTGRLAHAPPDPRQDKASGLIAMITELWASLGEPCPRSVVDRAVEAAESLIGADPGDLVVVHGDPHPANLLRVESRPGGETGYCFVDPDGFVADRAYDLGVALRDWTGRLRPDNARALLDSYCAILADRTGADHERIWRWGFVERVSTGLYVTSIGGHRIGGRLLESAGWLT